MMVVDLQEAKSEILTAEGQAQRPLEGLESAIFKDVTVALKVRLGGVSVTVESLLNLASGDVLKLDRQMNELVDIHLNDAVVARGEIVTVGDHFGVRIVEISSAK